jgi:hypothetical protein
MWLKSSPSVVTGISVRARLGSWNFNHEGLKKTFLEHVLWYACARSHGIYIEKEKKGREALIRKQHVNNVITDKICRMTVAEVLHSLQIMWSYRKEGLSAFTFSWVFSSEQLLFITLKTKINKFVWLLMCHIWQCFDEPKLRFWITICHAVTLHHIWNRPSVNGDILRRPSRTLHTTGYY